MMTAESALKLLMEGNKRSIFGYMERGENFRERREELSQKGQSPFALIICCSDSRVVPEIIFDQGIGDLFVVRTAGNVLDQVGFGSVEYGAEHLHIPLIIVLGHEQCGAVKAAIDGEEAHGCLKAIIEKIKPAIDTTKKPKDPYEACADNNIRNTVAELKNNAVIKKLIDQNSLTVLGAKYRIFTGEVEFFTERP